VARVGTTARSVFAVLAGTTPAGQFSTAANIVDTTATTNAIHAHGRGRVTLSSSAGKGVRALMS
jgi:hypothetical protein